MILTAKTNNLSWYLASGHMFGGHCSKNAGDKHIKIVVNLTWRRHLFDKHRNQIFSVYYITYDYIHYFSCHSTQQIGNLVLFNKSMIAVL